MTTDEAVLVRGDADLACRNEILRTVVGSTVHGMAIEGTDDRDEMGVFIEPPEYVLGLERMRGVHGQDGPSVLVRTQPEGARSGPGDLGLTIHSLRKYVRLVLDGNPTILLPLYAPRPAVLLETLIGEELRTRRAEFVSQRAGRRFLGYLDAQRERMVGGGRQSRVPSRSELIARHGYDTKYASHALRLGTQGVELMSEGRLSLPMPPLDLDRCMAVKTGRVPFDAALRMIDNTRDRLAGLLDDTSRCPLPAEPDMAAVNAWLVSAHRRHWARFG